MANDAVPASDAVLAAYAGYQHERAGLAGEDGTEMVLVNLYHQPLGAPMTYRAAKGWFETPFPEALTDEQAEAVLACCRRPVETPLAWIGDRANRGEPRTYP